MKKMVCRALCAAWLCLAACCLSVSCVNDEYVISEDDINLEVNVFQDGVVIPVGTTARMQLKDLLDQLDEKYRKYLGSDSEGFYSVFYKDSLDFSDSLAALKEMVLIEAIDFSEDFAFSLEDVDVSEVKVDAIHYEYEERLADSFSAPELPSVDFVEGMSYALGMDQYALSPEDRRLELEPFQYEDAVISIPEDLSIPSYLLNDTEIPLSQLVELLGSGFVLADVFEESADVNIRMALPEGITRVEEVTLAEQARIRVSIAMNHSLFTSGTINPYLDFDLTDLFGEHILMDLEMPAAGGEIVREYSVHSFVFRDEDWSEDANGSLILNKDLHVEVLGRPVYTDLKTTTRHLDQLMRAGQTISPIEVLVEFVDFEVKNICAGIKPVEVEYEEQLDLNLGEIVLPEGVTEIDYVEFSENSVLDFSVAVQNLSKLEGLDVELETLEIEFPAGMQVQGAQDSKLSYTAIDLAQGFAGSIRVERYVLPEPVSGVIALEGQVVFRAKARAEGKVNTEDLPAIEADDLKLEVHVDGSLEVDDYSAYIDAIEYPIEVSEHMEVEVPEELKDLERVLVYPQGNPVIEINVQIPDTDLKIGPMKEGVVITLPAMLQLKDVPQAYHYDAATHSMTFTDEIPSEIRLAIDCLVLEPVLKGEVYVIEGDIKVEGTVGVAPGEVRRADLDALLADDATIRFEAKVPELRPDVLALDHYVSTLEHEEEITLLEPGQLPEEVLSVGRIELEEVYANLTLDASALPELGDATLTLDFKVGLPELLILEDGVRDEEGFLRIHSTLDQDGKIVVDPIHIVALDLSGINLHAEEALKEKVVVEGTFQLSDASIQVEDWLNQEHTVSLDASIQGSGEDRTITISKLTGRVDYQMDTLTQSVDLTSLTSKLETENMEAILDLEHVHLAVDLETNLGVSAIAKAEIVPYRHGEAGEAVVVDLRVEGAESADQPKHTRFWLGQGCCPEGYQFVQIPILDMIRNTPDSLCVQISAGTDASSDIVIEPNADYILRGECALEVPLQLGEDFRFEFCDTLTGIPAMISTILRAGSLSLIGQVESSLPLNLDLSVTLLDEHNEIIELAENSGCQFIQGGNGKDVTVTDLNFLLAIGQGQQIPDIAAVKLNFVATSTSPSAPLNEETSIRAVLQALVPEGIHVDLRDFMIEEEEE